MSTWVSRSSHMDSDRGQLNAQEHFQFASPAFATSGVLAVLPRQ